MPAHVEHSRCIHCGTANTERRRRTMEAGTCRERRACPCSLAVLLVLAVLCFLALKPEDEEGDEHPADNEHGVTPLRSNTRYDSRAGKRKPRTPMRHQECGASGSWLPGRRLAAPQPHPTALAVAGTLGEPHPGCRTVRSSAPSLLMMGASYTIRC